MAQWILKFNRNKNQFNLNIGGRHFVYRQSRKEDVKEIDDWLINKEPYENAAFITFQDEKGKLHKNVPINTKNLLLWYDTDKKDNPDWKTYLWEIPTFNEGTIYIHAVSGDVLYDKSGSGWYKNAVQVRANRVSITIQKEEIDNEEE